jgi:hypothetical protein
MCASWFELSNEIRTPRRSLIHPHASATMPMKAMKKAGTMLGCRKKCGRKVKSTRAKLCQICFREQARETGARSTGNAAGNPGSAGNAAGNPGNAGNVDATGTLGNAGNVDATGTLGHAGNVSATGTLGNAGNVDATGNPGNAGNQKKGPVKKRAGKRSGKKRSAKIALVVKQEWLNLILAGKKDWEIRGSNTTRRGWIHLAESRACGMLMGRVRLVGCKLVARSSFMKHAQHHCVASLADVTYERIYAWIFEDAERFRPPLKYEHRRGAVIWVKV